MPSSSMLHNDSYRLTIVGRSISALIGLSILSGCASPELGDRISKSVDKVISSINQPMAKKAPPPANGEPSNVTAPVAANTTAPQRMALPDGVVPIAQTALAGIFAKKPYDGTPITYYPRVAVTVQDWSRPDCWIASATVWSSDARSAKVPSFAVCWSNSLSNSIDRAANYQLFLRQYASGHSGNVRGVGPKPPMLAYPMDAFGASQWQKSQDAIAFVQQLLVESGWKAGAPTNLWIVGYLK